jgi:hypothetical protein
VELVKVKTVYGVFTVSRLELESGKTYIPLRTSTGKKWDDIKPNLRPRNMAGGATMLHRENIVNA